MKSKKVIIPVIVGLIIILAVILMNQNVKQDEAILNADTSFISSFDIEPAKGNYESDQVTFSLPKGVEVTEETEYNIMLKRRDQVFLLFFNPLEPKTSEVHYLLDKEFEDASVLFNSKKTDDRFGYILILPEEEEELLKVTVGLGGAKVSTITNVNELEYSTNVMTEILHSLEYKE